MDDREETAVRLASAADQPDRRKAAGKLKIHDEHVNMSPVGILGGVVGRLPIADHFEAALTLAARHDHISGARVIFDDGNSNHCSDHRAALQRRRPVRRVGIIPVAPAATL